MQLIEPVAALGHAAGIEYRVQTNGFGDIVPWIPAATLFSRMIAAGALP